MPDASIEIRGVDELVDRLGRIGARETLRDPMQRSLYRLQRYMADYPPAPSNSSYRRTGTLGRRWTTDIKTSSDGMTGTVGNNTPYGPLVQSERFQARVHRGRWQTDQDAVRDNERAIRDDFERAIARAVGD